MKLDIKNFGNIAVYFEDTNYEVRAFSESTKDYSITLLHHPYGDRYVFIIDRKGYLTGGEWHYSTHVEGHQHAGCVTWQFMKNPENFVKHIVISIEGK